jgi:endonuclease VIII
VPEGDTLHRAARALHRVLAGKRLVRVRSGVLGIEPERLLGRNVERVQAEGKNLLVVLEGGLVVHTHLRMNGSWHLYRPGEAWKKPESQARLVLEVEDAVAVCFLAPTVRLVTHREGAEKPVLRDLGPDLLSPTFDERLALSRLRAAADLPLGEAIMRQDLVSGIGNIYKSETLFACRLDPFAPVGSFSEEDLLSVLRTARRFLRRNVEGNRRSFRITGEGDRQWVYDRSGRPCYRCSTPIRMRRQGGMSRSTYFCASCQRVAGEGGGGRP